MQWRATLLVVLLGVVAACGPTVRYVYNKPGVSEEQRKRDESDCNRQAMVTVSGGYYGQPSQRVDRSRFNRCMANRGYKIQEIREEGK
ncbi:MAG: hypothetical protein ACE5MG_05905 [Candidatus Methylomirabilales bacterium]